MSFEEDLDNALENTPFAVASSVPPGCFGYKAWDVTQKVGNLIIPRYVVVAEGNRIPGQQYLTGGEGWEVIKVALPELDARSTEPIDCDVWYGGGQVEHFPAGSPGILIPNGTGELRLKSGMECVITVPVKILNVFVYLSDDGKEQAFKSPTSGEIIYWV